MLDLRRQLSFGPLGRLPGVASAVAALHRATGRRRFTGSLAYRVGTSFAERGDRRPRVATLIGGAKLRVTFEEHLLRQAYFFGSHEPEVSELLLRLARPGETWVDVGANAGVFTMTLAGRVGPTGSVVAFEPNAFHAESVAASAELNGFDHVDVRRLALGAEAGEAELCLPSDPDRAPGGSGRASLVGLDDIAEVRRERVSVSTLDEELSVDRPIHGMKIDVEGFESAVLQGGERRFRENPPKYVLFEVSGLRQALVSPNELVRSVIELGYVCHTLPELQELRGDATYEGGLCDNVCAVRREAVEEFRGATNGGRG